MSGSPGSGSVVSQESQLSRLGVKHTVYPRNLDPFHRVTYYIGVKTSWRYSKLGYCFNFTSFFTISQIGGPREEELKKYNITALVYIVHIQSFA